MARYPPCLIGESLDQYINRELRPDEASNRRYNRLVDELSNFFKRHVSYSVKEVGKGGSLGRGTHLRQATDVELVIFLNNYGSVAELFAQLPSLLDNTDNKLRTSWGWKTKLTKGRKVNHALHYGLKYEDELIPLVILFVIDPYTSGKNKFDVVAEMYSSKPEVRDYYALCLSKQQNDFVSKIPVRAKDLILLLKNWTLMKNLDVDPLFVELVAVDLWRSQGKPSSFDLAQYLQLAMERLCNSASLQILWPDIWPLGIGAGTPVNTTPPCVWNPATPLHNLAPTGAANSRVCEAAQATLHAMRNNCVPGWGFGEGLQNFIETQVRPKPEERDNLKAAVHVLVTDLLHKFNSSLPGRDYRVKEVVKSGSLEKDTAVQNKMDIDLVVFFAKFTSMDGFLEELPDIINSLGEYLAKRSDIEVTKTDEWKVKCCLKLRGKKYDVDILPAVDLLAIHGNNIQSLYEEMAAQPGNYCEGKMSFYSSCLARVQMDFIQDEVRDPKSKLKDLIRLVKYWSKENGLRAVSYCLELICVAVYREYEQQGGNVHFNMDLLFHQVLQALRKIDTMRITFDDYYRGIHYVRYHETPFVMDPANPFASTLPREPEGRRAVAQMAEMTMQR